MIKGLTIYASHTNLIWVYKTRKTEMLIIWLTQEHMTEALTLDNHVPKIFVQNLKPNIRHTWSVAQWTHSILSFLWQNSLMIFYMWTKEIGHKLHVEPLFKSIVCRWRYEH